MLIGYMRVSQADGSQALTLQRDALLAAGAEPGRLYVDHATGKRDGRPGLDACLKNLHPGDTLLTCTLDRLGRDLRHLISLVQTLTERGVGLRVLASAGTTLDTTAPDGRLICDLFAELAGFERAVAAERTRIGLSASRTHHRHGGRPFKMTPAKLRRAQTAMARRETAVGELCTRLGISRQTLYRHVDPQGRLRPDGEALLRHRHTRRRDHGPVHMRGEAGDSHG